jgi:thiol-disulfide isomerase/thioredoxin
MMVFVHISLMIPLVVGVVSGASAPAFIIGHGQGCGAGHCAVTDSSKVSVPARRFVLAPEHIPFDTPSYTSLVRMQAVGNDDAEVSDAISKFANAFPFLSQSLSRAPILGLYFAASWCGDCDAVTPALAKVIASQTKDDELVHIVYVSSDNSAQQMAAYKPEQFSEVPWEAEEERSSLKRFFGTCAGKERVSLGMAPTDRKHGTPTLILLDTQSGSILTESGVEQVERMESVESVLEKWKSMLVAVHGK